MNVVTSGTTTSQPEHFVLSALILDTAGQSGVLINDPPSLSPTALISQGFQNFQKGKVPTFMDSSASDMMFVSQDAFMNYKSVTPQWGNSAKADNGSFKIVSEGDVC